MDLQLAGKVAVVTGGSSGLGRGCAEVLLEEGASVAISSSSPRATQAATDLAERHPGRVVGVIADMLDPEAPRIVANAAMNQWGRLDVAILSGGGPPSMTFMTSDDDAWRAAFESTFLGPVRMARYLASHISPGGAIGVVLSNSVYSPIPELALSNGLRPGLAMAMKTLSDELAPREIRVVGLIPGRIATSRTLAVDAASPEVSQHRNRSIPMGRLGTVEEFARVAVFATSPAASYITGSCIVIDGGALRRI